MGIEGVYQDPYEGQIDDRYTGDPRSSGGMAKTALDLAKNTLVFGLSIIGVRAGMGLVRGGLMRAAGAAGLLGKNALGTAGDLTAGGLFKTVLKGQDPAIDRIIASSAANTSAYKDWQAHWDQQYHLLKTRQGGLLKYATITRQSHGFIAQTDRFYRNKLQDFWSAPDLRRRLAGKAQATGRNLLKTSSEFYAANRLLHIAKIDRQEDAPSTWNPAAWAADYAKFTIKTLPEQLLWNGFSPVGRLIGEYAATGIRHLGRATSAGKFMPQALHRAAQRLPNVEGALHGAGAAFTSLKHDAHNFFNLGQFKGALSSAKLLFRKTYNNYVRSQKGVPGTSQLEDALHAIERQNGFSLRTGYEAVYQWAKGYHGNPVLSSFARGAGLHRPALSPRDIQHVAAGMKPDNREFWMKALTHLNAKGVPLADKGYYKSAGSPVDLRNLYPTKIFNKFLDLMNQHATLGGVSIPALFGLQRAIAHKPAIKALMPGEEQVLGISQQQMTGVLGTDSDYQGLFLNGKFYLSAKREGRQRLRDFLGHPKEMTFKYFATGEHSAERLVMENFASNNQLSAQTNEEIARRMNMGPLRQFLYDKLDVKRFMRRGGMPAYFKGVIDKYLSPDSPANLFDLGQQAVADADSPPVVHSFRDATMAVLSRGSSYASTLFKNPKVLEGFGIDPSLSEQQIYDIVAGRLAAPRSKTGEALIRRYRVRELMNQVDGDKSFQAWHNQARRVSAFQQTTHKDSLLEYLAAEKVFARGEMGETRRALDELTQTLQAKGTLTESQGAHLRVWGRKHAIAEILEGSGGEMTPEATRAINGLVSSSRNDMQTVINKMFTPFASHVSKDDYDEIAREMAYLTSPEKVKWSGYVAIPSHGTKAKFYRPGEPIERINSGEAQLMDIGAPNIFMSHLAMRFNRLMDTVGLGLDVTRYKTGSNYLLRGVMLKRILPLAAATTAYSYLDIAVDANPLFDGSCLDEGITVAGAEQGVKARVMLGRMYDFLGVTDAAKYAEGLMPGSVNSQLMRALRGTVAPLWAGAKIGAALGGPTGAGLGMLTGAGLGALQGFGAFDLTRASNELEDEYAGRTEVPVRRGRWWALSSGDFTGCLTPESPIDTSHGYRPIGTVQPGDHVLSGDGAYHQILAKQSRQYHGMVYRFTSVLDRTSNVRVTDEHYLLTVRPTYCSIKGGACYARRGKCDRCKHPYYATYQPQWTKARDIRVGDYLVYPKPVSSTIDTIAPRDYVIKYKLRDDGHWYYDSGVRKTYTSEQITALKRIMVLPRNKARTIRITEFAQQYGFDRQKVMYLISDIQRGRVSATRGVHRCQSDLPARIPLNYDFGLLLGYYAAEGCANNNTVHFAFHENETDYHADVFRLMNSIFHVPGRQIPAGKHGTELQFCSGIVAHFIAQLVPGKATDKTKQLHPSLLHAPDEFLRGFLRGLLNGDGTWSDTRSRIRLCLSTYDLIKQVQKILLAHDFHSTICSLTVKANGKEYTAFELAILERDVVPLNVWLSTGSWHPTEAHKGIFTLDTFVCTRVDTIVTEEYQGDVWDIQVEDQENFCGKDVIYHNSRINYFRPNWFARLKSKYKSTPDDLGSPVEQALFKPWPLLGFNPIGTILDPHHYAYKHYWSYPYPECVDPQTYIQTRSGLKRAGDIIIGDEVLTHDASYKTVHAILHKHHTTAFHLKIHGYFESLVVSGEHPFLVQRHSNCFYTRHAKSPKKCLPVTVWEHCTRCTHLTAPKQQWIRAQDIRPGDYVAHPRPKLTDTVTSVDILSYLHEYHNIRYENDGDMVISQYRHINGIYHQTQTKPIPRMIELDSAFGFLCGLYLAEGSVAHRRGYITAFSTAHHTNEHHIYEFLELYVKQRFDINTTRMSDGNETSLSYNNAILGTFMASWLGANSYDKSVGVDNPCDLDHNFLIGLLNGYFLGDGTLRNHEVISAKSVNLNLLVQIRNILLAFGIVGSINKDTAAFTLDICGEQAEKLASLFPQKGKFSVLTTKEKRAQYRYYIDDDYVYYRIQTIEEQPYDRSMVDFTIEGTHTFCGINAILHNTGTDFEDVPLIGPALAHTLGKIIAPSRPMHSEELKSQLGLSGYVPYTAQPGVATNVAQNMFRNGSIEANTLDVVSSTSITQRFDEQLYRATEAMGLWGFGAQSAMERLMGSEQPFTGQAQLANAGEITSMRRAYWDLQLGEVVPGSTELLRRLIPRPRTANLFNPLVSAQPSWLPDKFHVGSPLSQIPEYELVGPGKGYEATHDVTIDFPFAAENLGLSVPDTVRAMLGLYPHTTKWNAGGTDIDRKNRETLVAGTVFDPYHNISGTHDGVIRVGRQNAVQKIKQLSDAEVDSFQGPSNTDVSEMNFYLRQTGAPAGDISYVYNGQPVLNIPVRYSETRYMRDIAAVRDARAMAARLYEKGLGFGTEGYSHIDRLNILSNIAPYSDEYRQEEIIVNAQMRAGYDHKAQLDQIQRKRKAIMMQHEWYPYRFRSKVMTPDAEYNNLSLNENIKVAAEYSLPERIAGAGWEWFSHLNTPIHNKFMQYRSPLEAYQRSTLYGRDLKMWCINPNETIITQRGFVRAKDVQLGDKVVTVDGRWNPVTDILPKHIRSTGEQQTMYRINTCGTYHTYEVTGNHEIYVRHTKKCIKKGSKNKQCYDPCRSWCAEKNRAYRTYTNEWVKVKDLVPDTDYLVTPLPDYSGTPNNIDIVQYIDKSTVIVGDDYVIAGQHLFGRSVLSPCPKSEPVHRHIMPDTDFYKLLGWYLAEGYTKQTSSLCFAFHDRETEYIDDVLTLVKKIFGVQGHVWRNDQYNDHGVYVQFSSTILAAFFRSLFGSGANNKHIPPEFLFTSQENIKYALCNYFRGDGHYNGQSLISATTSETLANQIYLWLLSISIVSSIYRQNAKAGKQFSFKGNTYTFNAKISYWNNLNYQSYCKLYDIVPDESYHSFATRKSFIRDGYLYSRIENIETYFYDDIVYDFTVDGKQSYCGIGICYHNSHPIDHFMDAYARGFMSKTTPFQGSVAGAMAGTLTLGPGLGTAVGATAGAIYGCYDVETEALTQRGWLRYDQLTLDDSVLSYDKSSQELSWHKIDDIYVYDYDGDMFRLKSASYDLLISPEHRVLYYSQDSYFNRKTLTPREKKMKEISTVFGLFPQTGEWHGTAYEGEEFIIGNEKKHIHADGIALLKFLGFYVAEGWRTKNKEYKVCVSQNTGETLEWIKSVIGECGFSYHTVYKTQQHQRVVIASKSLWEWISCVGDGARNKHIPSWLMNLDRPYLEAFLEGYVKGDGCRRRHNTNGYISKGESIRITSASEQLIDDMQVVMLKLGYVCTKGHNKITDAYTLESRICVNGNKKWFSYIRTENIQKQEYHDKIWDVNIGGGYFVVRRNGRVAISGNSIHGVYRAITGTTYIPGSVREARSVNRYFDKISYTKNMMLYNMTGDDQFLEGARSTMTGLNPSDTSRQGWSYMHRATPPQERPFIMSFVGEQDLEERERIIKYVPDEVGQVLRGKWGAQDGAAKNTHVAMGATDPLPTPNWIGYSSEIPVDDVKYKFLDRKAMETHDFGLGYADQMKRVNNSPWLDRVTTDMQLLSQGTRGINKNQDPHELRRSIETLLESMGVAAEVTVAPSSQNNVTVVNV